MTIKQLGGVFGRNPTFNDVTIDGELILNGEIFTGLDFQGSWNASTNTPTLASGVGTTGEFYIVSVAGTTNLDGITNWGVGDWAMFSGSAWQRVEGNADGNFVNLSVSNEAIFSGNVGIGTASNLTNGTLNVQSNGTSVLQARSDAAGTNDGDTTVVVSRALNSTAGKWSNAIYRGYSHAWSYCSSAGTNQAMTIDSSGNVGMGTSIPGQKLEIKESSAGAGDAIIRLRGNGNNANNTPLGSLEWFNTDSSGPQPGVVAAVEAQSANSNGHMGKLLFKTHDGSGSEADPPTTRMIIDQSGNVLVGKTSTGVATAGIELNGANDLLRIARDGGVTQELNLIGGSDGDIIEFRRSNTPVGSVSVTGSATSYNTSSDQRLKENIEDADDAGSKIDAIQVRKFDWKADGSHQDYGMVAQELQVVAPEAVSAPEDSEKMMGVDYSKLVPMMLKEIQALRARVAQLES